MSLITVKVIYPEILQGELHQLTHAIARSTHSIDKLRASIDALSPSLSLKLNIGPIIQKQKGDSTHGPDSN